MFRKLMVGAVATAAAVAVGFNGQSAKAAPPIVIQPSIGGTYLPPSYPRPIPLPNYPRPVPTYPTFPRPVPTFPDRRFDRDYVVLVRHGNHWDRYGRYETLCEAERVERILERRGYRVRIQVIHDHR